MTTQHADQDQGFTIAFTQRMGVTLFSIALLIFTFSPALSTYSLHLPTLKVQVNDAYHWTFVRTACQPMEGQVYQSAFDFNSDLETHLRAAQRLIENDVKNYHKMMLNSMHVRHMVGTSTTRRRI